MRTVAKEPAAAKAKVIRKVASLRGMSLSQTMMKAECKNRCLIVRRKLIARQLIKTPYEFIY